jgi:hypothetical protein
MKASELVPPRECVQRARQVEAEEPVPEEWKAKAIPLAESQDYGREPLQPEEG